MLTGPAVRSRPESLDNAYDTVVSPAELRRWGWSAAAIRAQLDGRRWQRLGRAIVRHNGPLQPDEQRHIALLNCGPRAVLTAFTAAEELGLTGWERPRVHVLVPAGADVRRVQGVPMRVHYTGAWNPADHLPARRSHKIAPALVTAAGTFARPRPACGILAAGVQQRLVSAVQLQPPLSPLRTARPEAPGRPGRAGRCPALPRRRVDARRRPDCRGRGGRCPASDAAPVVGRPGPAERADDRGHGRPAVS
jgi:hypothetical protein